jgi:hypothetical protein
VIRTVFTVRLSLNDGEGEDWRNVPTLSDTATEHQRDNGEQA